MWFINIIGEMTNSEYLKMNSIFKNGFNFYLQEISRNIVESDERKVISSFQRSSFRRVGGREDGSWVEARLHGDNTKNMGGKEQNTVEWQENNMIRP